MGKLLVLVCAAVGAWFLLGKYLPQAWEHGFTLQGYFVSAAVIVTLIVVCIAYRLKSK